MRAVTFVDSSRASEPELMVEVGRIKDCSRSNCVVEATLKCAFDVNGFMKARLMIRSNALRCGSNKSCCVRLCLSWVQVKF